MKHSQSDDAERDSRPKALIWDWRLWLWLLALAAWTIGLVTPTSGVAAYHFGHISFTRKFIVAKTMHVLGYGFLTLFAAWQPRSVRLRRALLLVLLIHGPATEIIQRLASNRTGRLLDVALDYFGVLIGVLLTWKRWFDQDEQDGDTGNRQL